MIKTVKMDSLKSMTLSTDIHVKYDCWEFHAVLLICAIVMIIWGGNYFVKMGIKRYSDETLPVGYPSAGRLIGILERLLIFLILLNQFYSLVGFIITIKAIYRYGDINGDDRTKMKLSEYFIIGSLLSLFWVILVWSIYSYLIYIIQN